MPPRKSFVAALFVALAAVGCSGAVKPLKGGSGASHKQVFEKIRVPEEIAEADRPADEKILFTIPVSHPGRIPLRDRLAESYARSFAAVPEEKHERRLELFKAALALHEPGDWAPDRVAPAIVPMARWIVDRYESLGDEAVVLAGLRFLMLAEPSDDGNSERYRDLAEWSESIRATVEDDMDRYTSVGTLYMNVVKMVPDREVIDHLAGILIKRHKALLLHIEMMERQGGGMPPFLLRMLLQEGGMGKDMIHIYFLAGDPVAALPRLNEISHSAAVGEEYVQLLEDLEKGEDLPEVYFAMAGLLGPENPRAALKACLAARELDSRDPRFPMCIGMAFERMGRPGSAIDFYVEASNVAPGEEIAAQSMELVREALFEIHRLGREQEAAGAIDAADALVERSLDMEEADGDSIPMSAAALLFTCGIVEFDDGSIDSAREHFARASEIWPPLMWAVEKSAEIARLRGNHDRAIRLLSKAIENRGGGDPDAFWLAKFLELRADSYLAMGSATAAEKDYREAIVQWGVADVPDEQESMAALRVGVIHDRLGELEESRAAFRRAIRLDPDRSQTYHEILSFLVTRERLDDAIEFYGLAFNQDRIEAMWKIYHALWVDGLSRRQGKGPQSLAMGYLEQSDGDEWQDDLARFYTGRITLEDLRGRAVNRGQVVEADFYAGLKLLGEARKAEADKLFVKVVDSELMGFFEYKMALALIGKGI